MPWVTLLLLTHDFDVILAHGLAADCTQQVDQLQRQFRFTLGVPAAPGAALDLQKVPQIGFFHRVQINEKLRILIFDVSAQAVLLDDLLPHRLEVFTIEAQRVNRRSQETAAREQHIMVEFIFTWAQ